MEKKHTPKKIFDALKETFGYKNIMETPHIEKIVVSVGTGSMISRDKKKADLVADRLVKITGQKPAARAAKKSIASFKVREGDPVGFQVTLRGARMQGFLSKILNVALPRTKDFRGISTSAIDAVGNLTIGIKEHTVFPETHDEDVKDVFGMGVTIVTSACSRQEAAAFLKVVGFPLRTDAAAGVKEKRKRKRVRRKKEEIGASPATSAV